MQHPHSTLRALGLNEPEIQVYLAMLGGRQTAQEIIKTTGEPRATVYYSISTLERRGLISKTGLAGNKRYAVESVSRLEQIVDEKSDEIAKLRTDVQKLIPLLTAEQSSQNEHKPTVTFFEGVTAVKNVVMDSLYCRSGQIDVITPNNNFFHQVGKDFVARYVTERTDRKIKTRNLWENEIDTAIYKKYYSGLSEIRILPDVMREKFATTIFIFDDKVLQISSLKNSYAILTTS
ncbi:MAG: hypothetical protein NT003_00395, partial [Candidatus Magasanikbacteria bacterium]|nr:hypothetical protein [Candidatus Magasanikbacteria bacterium]